MANENEILEENENTAPPDENEAVETSSKQEEESAEEESLQEDEVRGETDAQEEMPQEEALQEDPDGTRESHTKEPKKFFKGKDKADKKKDKNKERISELEDKVKRQMAEFDNFRKRTEKEKNQMFEIGAKSVVEKILPVVDNFERGLTNVPEDENSKAFVEGMQMIYKQLMTELEAIGVTQIEAVGKEFNPDFHNAVMQVASEEYESGIVAQELQKGYMYRDSVVRHSMVSVVE